MGSKKKKGVAKKGIAMSADVLDINTRKDLEGLIKELDKDGHLTSASSTFSTATSRNDNTDFTKPLKKIQCSEVSSSSGISEAIKTKKTKMKPANDIGSTNVNILTKPQKGNKRKVSEETHAAKNDAEKAPSKDVTNNKRKKLERRPSNNEDRVSQKAAKMQEDLGHKGDCSIGQSNGKSSNQPNTNVKAIDQKDQNKKKSKKKKKRKEKKEPSSNTASKDISLKQNVNQSIKVFDDDGDVVSFDFASLENVHPRAKCIIKMEPGVKWFNLAKSYEQSGKTAQSDGRDKDKSTSPATLNKQLLDKIEKYTENLYAKEIENFENFNSKKNISSEKAWIKMVLKSGTLPDKMSAYSVLLQEDPVHNLASLEALVNMVSLKSRRPCMLALEALRDLFASHLLAENRKLKAFPGGQMDNVVHVMKYLAVNRDASDKQLILMSFEYKLKTIFARFLQAVDEVSKDTVDQTKLKAMSTIYDLLVANPEQEAGNLSRLVNNLGDPSRGVAAKAGYQLNKLLEVHPAMKNVVLGEVERLLYRPNVAKRAQYYGVCCLSQLMLDGYEDESVEMANKLIGIYFSFFKQFAVKKGDLDSKLISALLTGVNRAYPYLPTSDCTANQASTNSLANHVETMYRVVHMTNNFGTALQALTLLFQLIGGGKPSSEREKSPKTTNIITSAERFYTTLYKKLLDISGISNSSSKQALFLNLVYKAMKADTEITRTSAFARRLLQSCSYLPSQIICSILFLLSELFRNRPDIKQAFALNLNQPQAPSKIFKDNRASKKAETKEDDQSSSDEEEYYKDVNSEDEGEIDNNKRPQKSELSSWVFKNLPTTAQHKLGDKTVQRDHYDPERRNPLYALNDQISAGVSHDSSTCFWELSELSDQFHPSVQLFVRHLLDDNGPSPIVYSGDPLNDFTLMRFLDRFVFRNPKKEPGKGKPKSVFGKRNVYIAKGIKSLAVDGKEYAGISNSGIPADERFIHTYFRKYSLARTNRTDDHPDQEDDDDAASVNSDDFDGAIRASSKNDLDFAATLDADGDKDPDADIDDDDVSDERLSTGEDSDDSFGKAEDDSDFEEVSDFENLSDDMDVDENDSDEGIRPAKKKTEQNARSNTKHSNVNKVKNVAKKSYDLSSLMASAEDYEQLIEEDMAKDIDGLAGSINDVFNKDKSSTKQLKWEAKKRGNSEGRKSPNKVVRSKLKHAKTHKSKKGRKNVKARKN